MHAGRWVNEGRGRRGAQNRPEPRFVGTANSGLSRCNPVASQCYLEALVRRLGERAAFLAVAFLAGVFFALADAVRFLGERVAFLAVLGRAALAAFLVPGFFLGERVAFFAVAFLAVARLAVAVFFFGDRFAVALDADFFTARFVVAISYGSSQTSVSCAVLSEAIPRTLQRVSTALPSMMSVTSMLTATDVPRPPIHELNQFVSISVKPNVRGFTCLVHQPILRARVH